MILPFGTSSEQSFVRDCRSLRGDRIGLRDHAILWGLYVARAMSAVQIAAELFPGQQVAKARNQLNRLRRLGLVEHHRGGRLQGSDPYLWILTSTGFKALGAFRDERIISDDKNAPVPWSKVRLGAFYEWGWKTRMPGVGVPGRVKHDQQAIDFMIAYRRCIDAELTYITRGIQCLALTEWRCEHLFLAPWDKGSHHREGAPITLERAVKDAFPESKSSNYESTLHVEHGGFKDKRLRVVKPDGAVSIIIDGLPDTVFCKPRLAGDGLRPRETIYGKRYRAPQIAIDILIEYDRTGKGSANTEKLQCLDLFLNLGKHFVKSTPIHCLRREPETEEEVEEGYTPDVFVLFVCPQGKLHTIMTAADRTLTGYILHRHSTHPRHAEHSWTYNYQARKRMIFCQADSFGNITADIYDHERWLREPARHRPAPPAPRTGDRKMWRLPELPPASAVSEYHQAPTRDQDTFEAIPWEWPSMLHHLQGEDATLYADGELIPVDEALK